MTVDTDPLPIIYMLPHFLCVYLSLAHRRYTKVLSKDVGTINGSGDRVRLLNMLMQVAGGGWRMAGGECVSVICVL